MIAIGVLTARHQRQDRYSVSTPPSNNPMAAPPPEIAPKTPNAFARSLGSWKVTVIRARAAGASSAAKPPCNARAAKSRPEFMANPPSRLAPAKPSRPMMNVRLRPVKSAMRPPSSSRPPNARV